MKLREEVRKSSPRNQARLEARAMALGRRAYLRVLHNYRRLRIRWEHDPAVHVALAARLSANAILRGLIHVLSSARVLPRHATHRKRVGVMRRVDRVVIPSSASRFTCKLREKESGPDETRTRDLRHAKAAGRYRSSSSAFSNSWK